MGITVQLGEVARLRETPLEISEELTGNAAPSVNRDALAYAPLRLGRIGEESGS
jgi:hypothetical protein